MSETDNKFNYKDGVSLLKYVESRLQAIEKASELAGKTIDTRLDGMNEFRAAMKDQMGEFVVRTECAVRKQAVDGDIRMLREYKSALEGKASQLYVTVTLIISLLSFFLGIVGLLLKYHV